MARVRLLDDTELQEQPRVRLLDERELPGRGEEYGPPQPGVPEQYGPPAQMQQPPSVMADVGKGIGSGIERGVVGAPGMPTDLFRLAQLGWLTLQDKLYGEKGIIYQDPQHRARLEAQVAQQPSFLPGSSEIIEAAKPYVPGLGYEPQTKAGEVAQTFGEFIPGAVVPGQLAMRGASTAARVGRAAVDTLYQAAAPAAAAEGAEAAAKGTRFEPYAAPAAAVVTSLATGQLPLPRATTAVPGYSRGAVNRVNRAITDEGGHAAVTGQLDELGEAGRLMDAGPNLTNQAEALVSSPGRAQPEILRAVRERNAAAGDRITAAVDRTLGNPTDFEADTERFMQQRRLRANRFYGAAEAHQGQVDTTPVIRHIEAQLPHTPATNQAPAPTSIEAALVRAREQLVGRNDMRSLHNVKESLDDQIAAAVRANEGALANRLAGVRDRLVQQIDEGTTLRNAQGQPVRGPDGLPVSLYRRAREEYAGDSAILRAREEGRSVFDRDVDPRTLAREQRARSDAERLAFQEGARQAIEVKMGNARNDALAVRNHFEVPWNRAKMIQIIGQGPTEDLFRTLGQEARIAGTNARLTTQSATAGRQAAQKEFPSALPDAKTHWPSITEWPTRVPEWLWDKTGRRVVNALNNESAAQINRDAGRILTMPGGDERVDLLNQMRRAYEGGDRRTPTFAAAPIAGWSSELDEDRPPLNITVHPSRRR